MDYHSVSTFAQSYGLLYLFGLFIAVLAYALWPRNNIAEEWLKASTRNKEKFDKAAHIPLEED